MEEQLPIPITELIILHTFLSSISLLIGVIGLALIMRKKNKLTLPYFIRNSVLLLLTCLILSFLLWAKWPFKFDYMFGPFNLPTTVSLFVLLGIYLSVVDPKSL